MFLIACWKILCELAPWLLLGMFLSGTMEVLLPKNFIRKKLRGTAGVIKAVLLGVPLPLCSCGVIPAGIGLKNQGASHGAAVGFLISTPQTGVDSILVSASFFGWPFAIFKMVTAAITGVIGGWLTDRTVSEQEPFVTKNSLPVIEAETNCCSPETAARTDAALLRIWIHGLETLRSIWWWLVIGILISALIEVATPKVWFETVEGWGLLPAMLLVLLVSVPIYVCATASVPIAAAFVSGGLPPAVALVFLIAGPATNVTAIGAIRSRFGWQTLLIYLATILIGSMGFAWLFDWLLTAEVTSSGTAEQHHDHQNLVSVASAVMLLAMIFVFLKEKIGPKLRNNHAT